MRSSISAALLAALLLAGLSGPALAQGPTAHQGDRSDRTGARAATAPATATGAEQAAGAARLRRMPTLSFTLPPERYARYVPQTRCRKKPRRGVRMLATHLGQRGGSVGAIWRSCRGSSTSEHKESRAVDWMLDASRKRDRRTARKFLDEIFATDAQGNTHALARRMGIMYIIWNDRIYRSYDGFRKGPYLSSGCRTRKQCSPTLRHRDHVHISLTRKAARGNLSWYAAMRTLRRAR